MAAGYSWTTTESGIAPAKDGAAISYEGGAIAIGDVTTVSGDMNIAAGSSKLSKDLSAADSVYISSGRLEVDNASRLSGTPLFVKDGQLWIRCATLSNDLYLGASTYHDARPENGDYAALRIQNAGNSVTLSGAITLGENTRINATQNTTVHISGNIQGEGKALSLTGFYGSASRMNLSGTNTLGALNIAEATIGHTVAQLDVTISGGITTTGNLSVGLASAASLTVANGATLNVNGTLSGNTVTNNGTLVLGENAAIDVAHMTEGTQYLERNTDGFADGYSFYTVVSGNAASFSQVELQNNGAALLVVTDGSLTFAADAILTMGCDVNINGSTVSITLNGSTVEDLLAELRHGQYNLTLIDGLTGSDYVNLDNTTVIIDGETHPEFCLRLVEDSSKAGGYRIVVAPEPATATLSLLALAALAARRRRH